MFIVSCQFGTSSFLRVYSTLKMKLKPNEIICLNYVTITTCLRFYHLWKATMLSINCFYDCNYDKNTISTI